MTRVRQCADCSRTFGNAIALARHRSDTHDNPAWITKRKRVQEQNPADKLRCPACGGRPLFSRGKFGLKAAHCGYWSWGGKPLVDKATHIARIQAHAAFDPVWKSGFLSRSECYARLSVLMNLSLPECHISLMNREQACEVRRLVQDGCLGDAPNRALPALSGP